jgi:hypothetical protein
MAKIDINQVVLYVFRRELNLGCCVRRDLAWASSEVFCVSSPPAAKEAKSVRRPRETTEDT